MFNQGPDLDLIDLRQKLQAAAKPALLTAMTNRSAAAAHSSESLHTPQNLCTLLRIFKTINRSLLLLCLVLGQNGRGQNGTDKLAPIESSINQAIQLPLTI